MLWAMSHDRQAILSVVAGCLFEISLPADSEGEWQWLNAGPEVTLLAVYMREGREHFRFRAEAAGADDGSAQLRFESDGGGVALEDVNVAIAPEHVPAG